MEVIVSEKAQRVGIILIGLIFLASTIGVVVYSIIDNNNKQEQIEAINNATDDQNNPTKEQANVEPITCTTDTSLNYTASPPLKDKPLPNFTPTDKIPELACITIVPGSGDATVKSTDTVTVNYTGALAKNGNVFESSLDSGQSATFPLSGVIPGWTQGLPGMKVGETRRVLIPSALGYGASGSGTIPANSDLVFDVTLIKIGQ